MEWRSKRIHRGLMIEYASISWMVVEVAGALAAGILASSFALIAFGSDSIIELVSAIVVLGHLRKDSLGSAAQGERTALFTSLLLVSIVPVIGISSTYSFLVLKIRPETSILGLAVAIAAVVIMPILWREKRKIGLETNCLPLSIDAMESATCFFMSVALLGGLAAEFVFHLGWFDYIATLVILGFVAFEAKESFEEARLH
ncbi:MAG: cation transporter [Thaumarchaeota archaeon]|nr:cation transporter [Nitrososphaerota archaeon]